MLLHVCFVFVCIARGIAYNYLRYCVCCWRWASRGSLGAFAIVGKQRYAYVFMYDRN